MPRPSHCLRHTSLAKKIEVHADRAVLLPLLREKEEYPLALTEHKVPKKLVAQSSDCTNPPPQKPSMSQLGVSPTSVAQSELSSARRADAPL